MSNDFSCEQIIKVEKFQLYRLFRVNSFTQCCSKITNTKQKASKNFKLLQQLDNLGNIISSYYPKLIWIIYQRIKIRGNQFPEFADCLNDSWDGFYSFWITVSSKSSLLVIWEWMQILFALTKEKNCQVPLVLRNDFGGIHIMSLTI